MVIRLDHGTDELVEVHDINCDDAVSSKQSLSLVAWSLTDLRGPL